MKSLSSPQQIDIALSIPKRIQNLKTIQSVVVVFENASAALCAACRISLPLLTLDFSGLSANKH